METKKNEKADLEKSRRIFLQTGFIVSLALVLLAFEWSNDDRKKDDLGILTPVYLPDELPPVTKREEIKTTPPPKFIPQIQIVPDDTEPTIDYVPDDTEPNDSTMVIPTFDPISDPEDPDPVDFYGVEHQAQFPGGNDNLNAWLMKNTVYPTQAIGLGISGKVFVRFLIDKAGNVTNVEIERPADPLLDKEALRVVSSMPQWKPARQNTKPVSVYLVVPINFVLK